MLKLPALFLQLQIQPLLTILVPDLPDPIVLGLPLTDAIVAGLKDNAVGPRPPFMTGDGPDPPYLLRNSWYSRLPNSLMSKLSHSSWNCQLKAESNLK